MSDVGLFCREITVFVDKLLFNVSHIAISETWCFPPYLFVYILWDTCSTRYETVIRSRTVQQPLIRSPPRAPLIFSGRKCIHPIDLATSFTKEFRYINLEQRLQRRFNTEFYPTQCDIYTTYSVFNQLAQVP